MNWDKGEEYYNKPELSEDRALKSPMRYKMSFEDCVLAQDPACTYPIGSPVSAGADGEKSFVSQVKYSTHTNIQMIEGLLNSGFFTSNYSTQTIELKLFNTSVKIQLHFTQVFYGFNKMGLNNSG